jgi:hypothetical protein
MTECNTISQPGHHAERQRSHAPENRDCNISVATTANG